MRSSVSITPKLKKSAPNDGKSSSSAKKLVQARLPFKILPQGTSPSCSSIDTNLTSHQDKLKRKLSYTDTEENNYQDGEVKSISSNDLTITKKTKKTVDTDTDADNDDVVFVCDVDSTTSTQTPKTAMAQRTGAGTPDSVKEVKKKADTVSKVHIKFPFGNKKRRISARTLSSDGVTCNVETVEVISDSSDDVDKLAVKLNPLKRPKIENGSESQTSELVSCEPTTNLNTTDAMVKTKDNIPGDLTVVTSDSVKPNENFAANSPDNHTSLPEITDIDADDEKEITVNSSDCLETVEADQDLNKSNQQLGDVHDKNIETVQKKNLTPKQLKLMDRRRKAREEKERKLQEEKLQKQKEKEEKELLRKREREEKDELRRKERDEKDEQRRKEREDKEQKRLADIEAKNEEKRKRNDAKEEESRKKDEDRKRREQEKEDAELKKKKAAAAFTKFFVPKAIRLTSDDHKSEKLAGKASPTNHAFRPFQIKGDMKMAPICRKAIDLKARTHLEEILRQQSDSNQNLQLYLSELKSGKITPIKWRRPLTPPDDDVLLIDDELERAGQAIVEETHLPAEKLRAKFYKFHENRRPPFYGTWRKTTNLITPRRPLALDEKYFDYDVDSDLEWEEEEPGESLDGSEDDKGKESEDDEYEVDNEWFVPHGHLSEEELQNEDELSNVAGNNRETQKVKLQLLQQEFAQEMKRKTEKIRPRLIGCIWVDENGNQPENCSDVSWDIINQHAILFDVPPLINAPANEIDSTILNSTNKDNLGDKLKPIVLSDKMLKELVRLVHGNRHSKVFLINEFIAFVEANEESIKNGEVRRPHKSSVRAKIDEFAEWQATEIGNKNAKNKIKKRMCWVVSDDVLKKMELSELDVHNCNGWQYTLQPKFVKNTKAECPETVANTVTDNAKEIEVTVVAQAKSDITKFTKILTALEKEQMLKEPTGCSSAKASDSNVNIIQESANVPDVKKRVPLLMSVACGQSISTTVKNALISEFLQKTNNKAISSPDKKSTTTTLLTINDTMKEIANTAISSEAVRNSAATNNNMDAENIILSD